MVRDGVVTRGEVGILLRSIGVGSSTGLGGSMTGGGVSLDSATATAGGSYNVRSVI